MHRAALRRGLGYRLACLFTVITLAVVGGVVVFAEEAGAAITNSFGIRYGVNVNGSILLRGNTNLQCPASATNCSAARAATATGNALDNNAYDMEYTDADGDSGTFNDSNATISMPTGSTVLFAGLYWSADTSAGTNGQAAPTVADIGKVRFGTPAGGWNAITASTLYQDSSIKAYQGFADVTSLVSGAGNGVYRVADIQAGTGRDRYAGWSLAIAYQNSAEDMHSLRIFDGFGVVNSSSTSVNIVASGFQTPQSGTVNAKIGTVVYEGDRGKTGDTLQLNSTSMSDAENPATNFFNSTVSDAGSLVTDRTPGWKNLMGVDIDQFDASGKLANGDTQATLTLTTSGETFYPGVVTFTTDLYAPKLVTTTTATDADGGDLLPGDYIDYTIAVRNDGTDTASNIVLTDAIPTGTSYVPGSMTVAGTPVSDTSPPSFTLPDLAYNATTYVTFRVRVDTSTAAGSSIVNVPNVSYQGSTSSMTITGVGDTSTLTVQQPHANLAAGLTVTPSVVLKDSTPDAVSYTATVTNNGTDLEPAPTVTLTLPADVTAGTLPSGCSAAGQVITCTLGALAANTQASVTIPATADNPASAASVTVSGTGIDADTSDNTATATLALNRAPSAAPESVTTDNATAVTVPAGTDSSDADGDTLTVTTTSTPAHGSVVINADQSVTYTPVATWAGSDSFTYTVSDGRGGTDTATVTVTTRNGVPVAVDDTVATAADTPVTVPVLSNDTDPNNDTLTVTAVTVAAASGTASVSGTGVRFVPDAAFAGTADITYTISDGNGGTATAHLYVTVADAAPVAADDTDTVAYLGSVTVDVLANDTDANGDTLTISTRTTPDHGSAVISGGKIVYTAPTGFSGDATFTYTITDGTLTDTATVTVTVADAPPVAAAESPSIAYGHTVTLDVAADSTDPNGDALTVVGTTTPGHGTVVLNTDGTLTYTPATGFSGTDTFDYTISDGTLTSTATVTVTVANAPPSAQPDAVTVSSNAPTTIDVLANDSDPNGDALTITIDTPPTYGTAVIVAGQVIYTPMDGYHGTDALHYTITDGSGGTDGTSVTIVVVNAAPRANADAVVTATDSPATIAVLANDTDPNGDTISLTATTTPAHGTLAVTGGTVTYTPATGFCGTDTFTYTITDSGGLTATGTVTVTVTNVAPIAVDDAFTVLPGAATTLAVLGNDTDVNTGQVLSVLAVGTAAKGTVALSGGVVTYTPNTGAGGTDTFTYVITDDLGATSQATVTVTIDGVPVTTADTASTAAATAVDIDVLANDTDPEGETLTLVSVTTPQHGSAVVVNGKVRYTPAKGFSGTDTFTYTVRDSSGNTAIETVSVRVDNALPVAVTDHAAVLAGGQVDVDVLANDTDANGDELTIAAVGTPAHGTATLIDGKIRYVPADGFTGTDTFTYEISDGESGTATGTVSVVVSGGDPVAVPDSRTTAYQKAVTVAVLDNDLDPDGTLTLTSVTTPDHGTAVISGDTVVYTPPSGFSGVAVFEYTATDAAGHTTTATVTVTVHPAPVVPDKKATVKPGKAVTIALPTVDENGIAITVTKIGKPQHGKAVLNEDGTVTYTAAAGFSGTDSFTYTAVDADGNVTSGTITITVAGATKPPVAVSDRYTVVSGGTISVTPTSNDTDPYDDTLTIVKIGSPQHGTATLNADGTVTYVPADGFTGTDTFAYTIKDAHGGRARATVVMRVTSVVSLPLTGSSLTPVLTVGTLALLVGVAMFVLTGAPRTGRHRPGRHRMI
ncbi:Ig-like domain-containing protein [Actinoplanes sp. NPDC051851]|uniref:beta strand repeat-containing protein n=1 Tax=Actinoplanes sp. NPDC051851 TaxID=3154753 RepID=UPI003425831C